VKDKIMRPWRFFLVSMKMRTGCGMEYTATRTMLAQDPDGASGSAWEAESVRQAGSGAPHVLVSVQNVRRVPGRVY